MAKKATKKKAAPARPQLGDNVEILSAGEVIESPIMIFEHRYFGVFLHLLCCLYRE